MFKNFLVDKLFFVFSTFIFVSLSASAQSVLKYNLSEWVNRPTPSIQVHLDALQIIDVTSTPANPDTLSALQMTAGGSDPAKRNLFRQTVSGDIQPSFYTGCPVPTNPMIEVQTFQKPYMVRQGAYQGWINTYGSQLNLKAEKGLASNGYTNNLPCPLGINTASTAQTLGYAITPNTTANSTDAVELSINNSLNPWRWIAPMNVVHHAEQPSMALLIRAPNSTVARATGQFLNDYANGLPKPKRLYLDYTVDITIEDLRSTMNEYNVDDFLWGSAGNNLISKVKSLVYGPTIPYPTETRAYYQKRFYQPSIQVSLMVNMREDGLAWLSQEFMLASLNYARDTSYPYSPNTAMNNYMFEGGNNDIGASWYRLKVNALTDVPAIIPNGPQQIYKGGNGFWNIPDGNSSNTMWGTIDLTEFVKIAKGHQFLPGHRPLISNPAQQAWDVLSLNWAGVIFESHGPFKTKVKVRTFNISYR